MRRQLIRGVTVGDNPRDVAARLLQQLRGVFEGGIYRAEVIARTHAAGVEEVVVKRGADACLVSVSGQPLREVPAVRLAKEKVVDTTAAGDSFSAGYLAVRLTGGDAESAARRGHLTASTVIQYRGAIIPREAMPQ